MFCILMFGYTIHFLWNAVEYMMPQKRKNAFEQYHVKKGRKYIHSFLFRLYKGFTLEISNFFI